MKLIRTSLIALFSFALVASTAVADENHDTISKVMKGAFKGPKDGDSQLKKLLGGTLSKEDTKALVELVKTMGGTKAPVGNKSAYDAKIKELIEALDAVAGGDSDPKAITRLKDAQNCKACHSDHKPKKKK